MTRPRGRWSCLYGPTPTSARTQPVHGRTQASVLRPRTLPVHTDTLKRPRERNLFFPSSHPPRSPARSLPRVRADVQKIKKITYIYILLFLFFIF
jgi:hypothetical protein